MFRRLAALTVALCIAPSVLFAQSTVLTVHTAAANVHKSPSTGSPVIGKAPRGAVLEVTRELGSWVKIPWPDAEDGAGYVHVSTGTIAHQDAAPPAPPPTAAVTSPRPAPSPAIAPPPASIALRPQPQPIVRRRRPLPPPPAPTPSSYVRRPDHVAGIGGRVGGTALGYGATARVWTENRFGVQLEASRYEFPTSEAPQRVTSIFLEPSVVYALPDRVSDYWWLRPYVGSGASFRHHTLHIASSEGRVLATANKVGIKMFGGGELTFASLPRFALSADVGYTVARNPYLGIDSAGVGVSVSAHWYVR